MRGKTVAGSLTPLKKTIQCSVHKAGFTLLEVLVALSIFSIVSIALLGQFNESNHQIREFENRSLARLISQNKIVELRSGMQSEYGGEEKVFFGRKEWRVVTEVSPTDMPPIQEIRTQVYLLGVDIPYSQLTGYTHDHSR